MSTKTRRKPRQPKELLRKQYPPLAELTAWREGEGHTLMQAARLFGVSKTEMYRWEAGRRRIPPEKVPAVSAITEVPHNLLRPDIYLTVSKEQGIRELQAVG